MPPAMSRSLSFFPSLAQSLWRSLSSERSLLVDGGLSAGLQHFRVPWHETTLDVVYLDGGQTHLATKKIH
jgi:hypothetical protein